jgi:hypothetical protein
VQLTEAERDIHDTNTLWHTQFRIGVIDVEDGVAS